MNQKGILLSLLNTSTLILAYIILNIEISNNRKYLRIINANECLYFKLEQARGKISMKRRLPCVESSFTRCKCSLKQGYLLISDEYKITKSPITIDILLDNWFTSQIEIEDLQSFSELLQTNKLVFSIDRLFYPDWSHLIAAYIIITIHQTKLGSADFISLIALPYRNIYSIELCRALAVMKIVEYLILQADNKLDEY